MNNLRLADEHDDIRAVFYGVEVQRNSRVVLDVPEFRFMLFAEDQDSRAVPVKLYRPRFSRVMGIDRGEPDNFLLAQATVGMPAEAAAEV